MGARLDPRARRARRRDAAARCATARLALVLLPAPLLFVLFMGLQERYFGRWLLPVLPIVILLAAYGGDGARARRRRARAPRSRCRGRARRARAARAGARRLAPRRPRARAPRHARRGARRGCSRTCPRARSVVIEPFVPARWLEDPDRADAGTPGGGRWRCGTRRAPTSTTPATRCRRPHALRQGRQATSARCARRCSTTTRAGLLLGRDGSTSTGAPSRSPSRSRRRSPTTPRSTAARERARFSPYRDGAERPPFNFDWSFDYYPLAYARPGPGDRRLPPARRRAGR